ncbi:MAG: FHIPEP family type III secretion protein [Austwickia sp.]|nr:FHIPEP family type III secretion protein [Austwickia sp.]
MLIMLVSLNVTRPLDFAVFPSLLLIATLFRLASEHQRYSTGARRWRRKVIEAFGHFVVVGRSSSVS